MRTGHAVILEQGDLVSALLSSGALPGAWPPVSHNDDTLVEGGLVANVPLVQAVALGAASLVVLDAAMCATSTLHHAPSRRGSSWH